MCADQNRSEINSIRFREHRRCRNERENYVGCVPFFCSFMHCACACNLTDFQWNDQYAMEARRLFKAQRCTILWFDFSFIVRLLREFHLPHIGRLRCRWAWIYMEVFHWTEKCVRLLACDFSFLFFYCFNWTSLPSHNQNPNFEQCDEYCEERNFRYVRRHFWPIMVTGLVLEATASVTQKENITLAHLSHSRRMGNRCSFPRHESCKANARHLTDNSPTPSWRIYLNVYEMIA